MSFELDGFAENEDVVDGDWEAHNYCLAENYYDAMLGEDFDLLGEVDCCHIEEVMFWLDYDDEIGEGHEEEIAKIRTGLFVTCKNRTFIDAIVANKNVSFAETYIQFGCQDVRLFAICMFGVEIFIIDGEKQYNGTILNMINRFCKDKDDYVEFLSNLFALLDEEYNKLDSERERIEFLDVVRRNIKEFKYSCSEKIGLSEICDISFSKKLVNK